MKEGMLNTSAYPISYSKTVKLLSFLTGAFVAGIIQGFALGSFGAFEDSAVYFNLYKDVQYLGIYDGLQAFMAQTSKFEPVLILLFALESKLSGGLLSEYWFLVINMTLLNVLVSMVMFPFIGNRNKNSGYLFFVGFTVVSGYLVFSKELYVWRSVVAFAFFILFAGVKSWQRWLWAVAACSAHTSFVMFLVLLVIIESIYKSDKKYLLVLLGIGMLGSISIVQYFPGMFEFMVGGGDLSVFLSEGGEHTIKAWLANLFALFILLLLSREYMANIKLGPLYIFCLITVIASLVAYGSYHYMARIILPASLIVGFLPFLIESNSFQFKLARLCIVLSILPSARLLFILFSGDFIAM
jgi:hypothetical protein